MTYIQKQIGFWDVEGALPASYKTGTTLEEYDNGAYLLLNAEQVAFSKVHPNASPLEVWNMELIPEPEQPAVPEPDELSIALQAKLQEIADQDAFS